MTGTWCALDQSRAPLYNGYVWTPVNTAQSGCFLSLFYYNYLKIEKTFQKYARYVIDMPGRWGKNNFTFSPHIHLKFVSSSINFLNLKGYTVILFWLLMLDQTIWYFDRCNKMSGNDRCNKRRPIHNPIYLFWFEIMHFYFLKNAFEYNAHMHFIQSGIEISQVCIFLDALSTWACIGVRTSPFFYLLHPSSSRHPS